jgi:glycosyltransferase involved in cell wall biosynthesis
MRILVVATQLPVPPDTGGKIRTLNILKHLGSAHDLTLACTVPPEINPDLLLQMEGICSRFIPVVSRLHSRYSYTYFLKLLLNFFSSYPFGVAKDFSPALARCIQDLLHAHQYHLVLCDFLHASINLPARSMVPIILFQHNVEAEIFRRHNLQASNKVTRAFWHYQWKKIRAYEQRIMRCVDHCIIVSETDRRTFQREYNVSQVSTIDTGVDVDYFSHSSASRIPHRMVFTGSMDWLPNEDAMLFFAQEVLPAIVHRISDASLVIVGRHPSTKILRLNQKNTHIVVTGRVEDVRPYLAEASVFVAPLRIGGGTRIKIFEAMASGLPVVSTAIGAEGLSVQHGRNILSADTPQEFADAIVNLFRNESMWTRVAENGKQLVTHAYDWPIIARQFSEICLTTIQKCGGCHNGN